MKARENTVAVEGTTKIDPTPWMREITTAVTTAPHRFPIPPTITMMNAMMRISRPIMKSTETIGAASTPENAARTDPRTNVHM